MLKSNYHTHTKLCNHAVGMCEDYIKKAIELGFKEIGMSDHAPVPREFMSEEDYEINWVFRNMTLEDYYEKYLPNLDEAINTYGDQIKIYRGLETEFIEGHEEFYLGLKANLDYLNLGIHYFESNGRQLNSYDAIDYKTIYDYANTAIKGMNTGIFKCLVHPDLFFFQYKDENGEHKFDKHCEKVSKMLIESAIKNNMYIEINCNGLHNSRKYGSSDKWLYPLDEFWNIAKEYKDLKVIIGCDAHDPENLYNDDVKVVVEKYKGFPTLCEYMEI